MAQLLTTRVQMDMSEILSHCRLHKPFSLIKEDGAYIVAEYLDALEVESEELSSVRLGCWSGGGGGGAIKDCLA